MEERIYLGSLFIYLYIKKRTCLWVSNHVVFGIELYIVIYVRPFRFESLGNTLKVNFSYRYYTYDLLRFIIIYTSVYFGQLCLTWMYDIFLSFLFIKVFMHINGQSKLRLKRFDWCIFISCIFCVCLDVWQ